MNRILLSVTPGQIVREEIKIGAQRMSRNNEGAFNVNPLFAFCLTYLVGSAGFLLFRLLKVPTPALLGSMFATSLMGLTGFYPKFPVWVVSFCSNTMIGVMIGKLIDRNVLKRIWYLGRYVVLLSAGMIALSLLSGYALYRMTDIPLTTALISGAAGGIAEMVIYGMSVDADVAIITFVQIFRVVTFLMLIPYMAIIAEKIGGRTGAGKAESAENPHLSLFDRKEYAVLVLCAVAGGMIGRWLEIPTGALIGAMLASGALALAIGKEYRYDPRIRCFAQIALGMVMGERMTPQILSQLGELFFPAVAMTVLMLFGSALLAFALYKTTQWDVVTCLLCASPAGLSQITIYADEVGADVFTASVFHTVRIISIVALYPWITMFFTRAFQ